VLTVLTVLTILTVLRMRVCLATGHSYGAQAPHRVVDET